LHLLLLYATSCSTVKRLGANERLLTQTTVMVDDKKERSERVNNLIAQKPNSKLLGIPLRLQIYNLAKPNSDSILNKRFEEKLLSKPGVVKLLSEKQLSRWYDYKKGFHERLRKIGEPPAVYNQSKTDKTLENLKAYYFNQGWFNATFDFEKDDFGNKKRKITYKATLNTPFKLDTINRVIASSKIDSIYQKKIDESYLKSGEQYKTANFAAEQSRLNNLFRNSGFYHFTQDYVFFELDTLNNNHTVDVELQIKDRIIRSQDSTITKPFEIYKIKNVNIFTDDNLKNRDTSSLNLTTYKGYNIYSTGELKYKPKALVDNIFIAPGDIYADESRTRTYRFLSNLNTFKYPAVDYKELDSTHLQADISLAPLKKYSIGFDLDVMQSNIQTIGFSFSTSVLARNIFKGAETLELSAIGSIGASKDASDTNDRFFDITELGANLKLTFPRMVLPFNTDKIIPKYMSPRTQITLGASSQRNIGLDKQTFNTVFNYQWKPSQFITNRMDLGNIEFIRNLNVDNYFGVYQNSFSRLNFIAREVGYINATETLSFPTQADDFIREALSISPSFVINDEQLQSVNNINERKNRLTANNLIFASNFSLTNDTRESILQKNFSVSRVKFEIAGNVFQTLANALNFKKNDEGQYEFFDVAFSQYVKTELDYIKHWHLGGDKILAVRSFLGIAIPYGNASNIPFLRSFYAGGPNDNRAWTAYNLGPGTIDSSNEFNEANLKLAFSAEYRFGMLNDLNGALFIDAGNIWNVLDDVEDERAVFEDLSSLKELAVGAGFGLRYDFGLVVARLDIGFKAFNPNYTYNNTWFNQFNFGNAVYNIGINYPF
jgi:hypothetical protein